MNAKPLILIVFLLCIVDSVFSQTSIDVRYNSMRVGDVVKTTRFFAGNIWDLSKAEKSREVIPESYEDFKTDTITRLSNGKRGYYVYRSDSLLYVGSECPQQKELFYNFEIFHTYPMSLGDSIEGFFAGYTEYCDKVRLHRYGMFFVHADSIGTLTLPDGDLLNDVLQVSHKRRYKYDSLDTDSLEDLPAYSEREILQRLANNHDFYCEEEKELYAKGYRYPIVRDFVLRNSEGKVLQSETYYNPVDEQEGVFFDEANAKAKEADNTAECEEVVEKGNIIPFVSQNSEFKKITFDYEGYMAANSLQGVGQFRFVISDSKGIVYRSKQFTPASQNHEICLSYSGLRNGQYIVCLVADKKTYTCNFIVE